MTKPFSPTTCRKRMGLTQAAFGTMLHMGTKPKDAERAVQKWEEFERKGTGHPPRPNTIILMMVMEKIWRIYHGPDRTKKALAKLLPAELRDRKP